MEFRIRDLTDVVNELSLEQINKEISAHKIVLAKIASPVFKRKLENNIIVLQMKRIELMKLVG